MGGQLNYQQLQQAKQSLNQLYQNTEIARNNYGTITRLLIAINNTLVSHIIESIEDYSLISSEEIEELYKSVSKIYHLDDGEGIHDDIIKNNTLDVLCTLSWKKDESKQLEIERYWKDKPERKKELEELEDKYYHEKIKIDVKIDDLKDEILKLNQAMNKPLEEEEERKKLINNQNELINQKNSLGLFKGKEKAFLQNKIDEKQDEIDKIDIKIEDERLKLKDKYQPKIDDTNKEIDKLIKSKQQLEQKEKEIKKELYLED